MCGECRTQIAYQKWVSMFMQGMEAWTEVRRTLVPALVPGCRAVLRHIPERLPYEDQEAVLNKTNLDAAVAAQGFSAGNDLSKPLWFTGRTTSPTYPAPPCPFPRPRHNWARQSVPTSCRR